MDLRSRHCPCGTGLPAIQLRNPARRRPISSILLRTGLLATVGLGCVLLSRVQRSRVSTIARLLDERTDLLAEMVTIEQREQRDLAETLHDGAPQYVLAARQELEAVEEGDPDAAERIDHALAETSRLCAPP